MKTDEKINLLVRHLAQTQQPASARPKELRAFTAYRDKLVGGLADIVLRVRISDAVCDAFVIACRDMRHAVLSPLDLNVSVGASGYACTTGNCGDDADK